MSKDRIEVLARRVRWLDCYRRGIAIGVAIVLAPFVIHELSSLLGVDWPQFHATLLTLLACVFAWWTTEVGLAWMAALWETECDRLTRDRGLPRAELLPPRK